MKVDISSETIAARVHAAIAEEEARGRLATVERGSAGPDLFIAGIEVRSWFGTNYNDAAEKLAVDINAALASGESAKDATIARLSAQVEKAREALAAAEPYVSYCYDEESGEEAAEAHHALSVVRAALAMLSDKEPTP